MMGDISIRSMSQDDAQEMCSWEYSGQYRVYNNSWEKMAEQHISYADEETRRKEFYTLLRDGKMIGFFRLRRGEKVVELGLGLRPDLCGQGLGKKLVQAAVQEHKKRFGDLPLACSACLERARDKVLSYVRFCRNQTSDVGVVGRSDGIYPHGIPG